MNTANKPCQQCAGTGKVVDQAALGESLRKARAKTRKTLTAVAKAMDISAPYLSDLERGHRFWSIELIERFKKAIA